MAKSKKHVYFFGNGKAEGDRTMKELLGGKGSGLAEMTNAGLPVPPGFTIATTVCTLYYENKGKIPTTVDAEMLANLKKLEATTKAKLGASDKPLLVSVRSGAKFSMPGMMDTILNLGLNDASVEGLKSWTGNGRFAWDSYRRFIQMFGSVVLEIPKAAFEHEFEAVKHETGAKIDTDLTEAALQTVVTRYKAVVKSKSGKPFPQDPLQQLRGARDAVFRSWQNPRAKEYRRIYEIPDHIGTAVNVQSMVFGNTGDRSATGVGFTRNPATGAKEFYGEFLVNAQGEDVVAGIRTPRPIAELETVLPKAYKQLRQITTRLEKHYKDVQDFEFTIQDEQLYMLQTRNGKRTGYAAVVIAADLVAEKLVSPKDAVLMVEPEALSQLLAPIFDPKDWKAIPLATKGLPASPGAASGQVVFTADDAVEWTRQGKKVMLVRKETVPDDIHGMFVAQGILTATGGMTSHAAVVGRQMGKPSVVGAGALAIDERAKTVVVGGQTLKEGDWLSFDGLSGEVKVGQVATTPSEILQVVAGKMKPAASDIYRRFNQLLSWADKYRRLAFARTRISRIRRRRVQLRRAGHLAVPHRAHVLRRGADSHRPEDDPGRQREGSPGGARGAPAAAARGLLRRLQGDARRAGDDPDDRSAAPRCSCPKREDLMVQLAKLEATGQTAARSLRMRRKLLHRVEQLHEFNPMLGHRGVRLGITYPEITEMQTRAIMEAACQLAKEGGKVVPEIMIPLVGDVRELRDQKAIVVRVADEVMKEQGVKVKYLVGTMIEVPRGAMTADEMAKEADFFSFGTNDLTQLTYGFSRDDIGKFLGAYQDKKILERDPFASLDTTGVGSSSRWARQKGRATKPDLKVGVCGEHGGDPSSIFFFEKVGLNYVSCSPYRVPVGTTRCCPGRSADERHSIEGRAMTVFVYSNGVTRQVESIRSVMASSGRDRESSGSISDTTEPSARS
jgi:pyruvate,orthophosphate dikinase